MHASVLIAFAAALAVVVAVPGPGIFAVVSCAIARGLREALALICGVVMGDLIYFTAAVLGMATLARSMGDAFLGVKIAGAVYLAWLGVRMWRQPPATLEGNGGAAVPPRGFARSALGGLAVTLGNPKAIAFYAGLLPTFVDLERLSRREALAMAAIVVVVVAVIPTAYAVAAAASRRLLGQSSRVRMMNRIAGTMMLGAAIAIAVE